MYKGDSYMDCNTNSLTVSDKNAPLPTPFLDKIGRVVQRIADKVEEKMEYESKHNPVGFFSKVLLCIVCCARIILGDSDEDVRLLKSFAYDDEFKLGCEKEVLADPDSFRGHPMLQ